MRTAKGTGMSVDQVNNLSTAVSDAEISMDECVLTPADYPAYELYTEVLRQGIYPESGRQLRLVVGKDRRVKDVINL